jgi:hypothetical protein
MRAGLTVELIIAIDTADSIGSAATTATLRVTKGVIGTHL